MSLSSSLYTGISGLRTLGNSMQIIGDNISNVNTVGFKNSRYVFQDVLSQSVATQSGTAQIGRGSAMGDIGSVFEQGSFESTGNTTDLGISGNGFFVLREASSQKNFYTRAGNFEFDKDGILTTPEGFVVQGWELDSNGDNVGAVKDILLSSFTSSPKQSSILKAMTNLNSAATSKSGVLSNAFDSANATPLAASGYEYQTTVKVFDSLGSTHDVTVYYDKKEGNDWEYLITANPDEDKRNLVQGTDSKGILARGVVTFSESSGSITSMTMEKFDGIVGNLQASGSITKDDIEVTVNNFDKATVDGHGFGATFNGTAWSLTLPGTGYAGAAIVAGGSGGNVISIDLDPADGSTTPDLVINLAKAAQNGDSVQFDINAKANLHEQSVKSTFAVGVGNTTGTLDNTTTTINNPSALVANESGTGGSGVTIRWDGSSWALDPNGSATGFSAGSEYSTGTSYPTLIDNSKDKVSIDLNNDGKADVTYGFTNSLATATTINLEIEGSSAWSEVKTNTNGYFAFDADFLGGSVSSASPHGTEVNIEFDIGTKDDGTGVFVNSSLTSTQFARASSTVFQNADGYGAGDLQGVNVSVNGTITGTYSNGQLIPLYRVALAKFLNIQGLFKEGGNLYRETRDSGAATTNIPGTNGLGNISPNSLEQSNVDVAKEFVNMISSQRGFQANSKIITTVDSMLGEVIQMKR